jgi:hypothetical protein
MALSDMCLKAQKNSPDMAELRRRYGHILPTESAGSEFHEIAPGHVRKVYHTSTARERVVLTPPMLQLANKLRPLKEIAVQRNDRTLEQLLNEVGDAIRQLLCRAHCGDQRAIATIFVAIHHAVEALEHLAKNAPKKVRAVAETLPRWPVLLSLNPQEIEHVKRDLKSLGVGTKALTPTRPGQRRDPRNLWTRIADESYAICRRCKHDVPELETVCRGTKRQRKTVKYWETVAKATYYQLSDGTPVIITDWQKQCKHLSEPITDANFKNWWKVVKLVVLQYWTNPEGNYREALNLIGNKDEDEWRRRGRALERIEQAFRSLLDLPR